MGPIATNHPRNRCHTNENTSDSEASLVTLMANCSTTPATHGHVADASFDKSTRLAVLYLEIMFGSVGNLLVFIWLWRNRRRKSRITAIIGNLAIADELVIAFACIMQVVWEHVDRLWVAGNVMCKLLKFMQSLAIMASVNMLVALSIDRHQAIRMPLHRPPLVRHITGVGWFLAATMSLPQMGVFSVNIVGNKTVCESMFRTRPPIDRQAYLTFVNLIVFVLPTILMLICYVRIFTKISSKAAGAGRKEASSPLMNRPTSDSVSYANTSNDHRVSSVIRKTDGRGHGSKSKPVKIYLHSTQSGSLHRAKIKSLKMAVVVVLVFVICSAPYHILEMIYSYGQHFIVPSSVAGVLGAMAVANSAMNPYVILYFNLDANNFCHAPGSRRVPSEQSRRAGGPRCANGVSRRLLHSQDDHIRSGEPIVTGIDVIADEHVNGVTSSPEDATLSAAPSS